MSHSYYSVAALNETFDKEISNENEETSKLIKTL